MQIMPEHDHNNEFVSPPDITNEHLKCPGQQHEMLVKLVNFREFFLKLDDFIYNSNENQSQKIENNYKIDLGIRIY